MELIESSSNGDTVDAETQKKASGPLRHRWFWAIVKLIHSAYERMNEPLVLPASKPHFFSPIDVIALSYLILTLPIFAFNQYMPTPWVVLQLLLHVGLFFLIIIWRCVPFFKRRIFILWLDSYSPWLYYFFYKEIGTFISYLHGSTNDEKVEAWEGQLFGFQPSQEVWKWIQDWPFSRLLGEYIHIGYFSMFPLFAFTSIFLLFTNNRKNLLRAVGCMQMVFFTCMFVWIFYPVRGPFEMHGGPPANKVGYWMANTIQTIVRTEHSTGTAFPSSHCAMGASFFKVAYNYLPRQMLILYYILVPPLILGTVFGGFHYAIDSTCGVIIALVVWPIADHIMLQIWSVFENKADKALLRAAAKEKALEEGLDGGSVGAGAGNSSALLEVGSSSESAPLISSANAGSLNAADRDSGSCAGSNPDLHDVVTIQSTGLNFFYLVFIHLLVLTIGKIGRAIMFNTINNNAAALAAAVAAAGYAATDAPSP